MKVGIVGAEAAKFTPLTEQDARWAIRRWLRVASEVISGHSPLGGIDWWAIEEAELRGIPTREYPPAENTWEGGFKPRNLQIARESDIVVCIAVKALPETYTGRRFPRGCYHCGTPPTDHVKSGGCWTVKEAKKLGKRAGVVVIG